MDETRRTSIPRTSGVEHPIDPDQADELDEMCHDPFPPSLFLDSRFYKDFLSQEKVDPLPLFLPPDVQSTAIDQPKWPGATVSKCIIHMLKINKLIEKARSTDQYLLSWCNLSKEVDARQKLDEFYTGKYRQIDKSTMGLLPELSWAVGRQTFDSRRLVDAPQLSATIFHYIGLGMPPPQGDSLCTMSGEWKKLDDVASGADFVCSLMIFDCDRAGVLADWFLRRWKNGDKKFIGMFACLANENLNIPSHLPHDLFTSILLSPDQAYAAITGVSLENHGSEFVKVLDLFMETIAQDVLPPELFFFLFRWNPSIGSLWRRFLLAQKLLKEFGIHAKSVPELPDMTDHCLWRPFAYSVMRLSESGLEVAVDKLCDLYVDHCVKVRRPSRCTCAMMTAMLQIKSKRDVIVSRIAELMVRSPQNCYAFGSLISVNWVAECALKGVESFEIFRKACIVVSGAVLAVPSLARRIRLNPQEARVVVDREYDEMSRVYLLSICVASNDSLAPIKCYPDTQKIGELIPFLFSSSPLLREWFTLLIHAMVSVCQPNPRETGKIGLHVAAMLLLYEDRIYTRAAGVALLSALIAQHSPEFNDTVLRCAVKAAFDGSSLVRLAFVRCVAVYAVNNKDNLEYQTDDFLDKLTIPNATNCLSTCDTEKVPARQLLLALTNDPCPEVREAAKSVLENPSMADWDASCYERIKQLHRIAHRSLFSKLASQEHLRERYPEDLFARSDLELEGLESLTGHTAPVTVVTFDSDHGNVCSGHADGTVCWADNKWKGEDSPVSSICQLRHHVIAVGYKNGVVCLFRNKTKAAIDCFRPSLEPNGRDVVMATAPDKGVTFISQGTPSITVWNLQSLLRVAQIKTEAVPLHFVIVSNRLYCALEGQVILHINVDTYEVVERVTVNSPVLRIGDRFGKLYTVLCNGEVYIWESLTQEPRRYPNGISGVVDISLHRVLRYGVIIVGNMSKLMTSDDGSAIEITMGKSTPLCCCFDDVHPLCAVGHADGSVDVWRVPNKRPDM